MNNTKDILRAPEYEPTEFQPTAGFYPETPATSPEAKQAARELFEVGKDLETMRESKIQAAEMA